MDELRTEALDEVLRAASVPIGTKFGMAGEETTAGPNLYVLGSLERRVTIYAQQIRALNLITALQERVGSLDGKRVAIVGGGIAGLTAAVGAAELRALVTVLEIAPHLLPELAGCDHRWLHPNIYDWPRKGWSNGSADLPKLTWSEERASVVADALLKQWKDEVDAAAARKKEITLELDLKRVWLADHTPSGHVLKTDPARGIAAHFDIVILAVGFGAEQPVSGYEDAPRYWLDTGIPYKKPNKQAPGQRTRVLVAGCGDGGLIDVLRSRILNFKQAGIADVLDFPGHESLEERVEQLEHDLIHNRRTAEDVYEEYKRLPNVGSLDLALQRTKDGALRLRADTVTTLCGTGPTMVVPNASPLHRVLVHRLVEGGQWGGVNYVASKVKHVKLKQAEPVTDHVVATLANGSQLQVDHVILRPGPESSLEASFPGVRDAMRAVLGTGRSPFLPRPLWEVGTFAGRASYRAGRPDSAVVRFEDWSHDLRVQISHAIDAASYVDIHVCHAFDQFLRHSDIPKFRTAGKRLRLIVSDISDAVLRDMLLRKYAAQHEYPVEKMAGEISQGLETLFGGGTTLALGPPMTITPSAKPPFDVEIYASKQRITISYYRADDQSWIVPLRSNESRDPVPRCFGVSRRDLPETFAHYQAHFETIARDAEAHKNKLWPK